MHRVQAAASLSGVACDSDRDASDRVRWAFSRQLSEG